MCTDSVSHVAGNHLAYPEVRLKDGGREYAAVMA
ncbi:TPA: hypothetical protein ACOVJB_002556 [Klebsiella oxytoca]